MCTKKREQTLDSHGHVAASTQMLLIHFECVVELHCGSFVLRCLRVVRQKLYFSHSNEGSSQSHQTLKCQSNHVNAKEEAEAAGNLVCVYLVMVSCELLFSIEQHETDCCRYDNLAPCVGP